MLADRTLYDHCSLFQVIPDGWGFSGKTFFMALEQMQALRELTEQMVQARTFAVLGASRDPDKYGSMVYHDLKRAGKTVTPVNPRAAEIDGAPCFPTLSSLPAVPDIAVFVVPPSVSEAAVEECALLGIKNIWMQEGAESAEAVSRCGVHGIAVVHGGPCIMVLLRTHGYLHS